MTITLYGIPNCDKVKAARRFLDSQQTPYAFVDLRQSAIDPALLALACQQLGVAAVLNKASTTYRQLPAAEQALAAANDSAIALMLAHPTLIKRPLLIAGQTIVTGFDPGRYQTLLAEMA